MGTKFKEMDRPEIFRTCNRLNLVRCLLNFEKLIEPSRQSF